MGGGWLGKCQVAFSEAIFLWLNSNIIGKCQKWMYNEAVLETLIGWISFFLLLFFLLWRFSPFPGDSVFTMTLIKSEAIISFKLQTQCFL